MVNIEIDKTAGFCWGVVQTIDKVEKCLADNKDKQVYVLGEIIHNPHEIERLKKQNLKTINYVDLSNLSPENSIVVIRAHGEPPATYELINTMNLKLVDATCPLVRKLQEKVALYYQTDWQIVIYGKYEHAEVIGLRGFCNDKCIVIKSPQEALDKINPKKKVMLCSQTTMDAETLLEIEATLRTAISNDLLFVFNNTICKFVINRKENLQKFAKSNDLVIFVAGNNSSNGKVLFDICKNVNSKTLFVEDFTELNLGKLRGIKSIGLTGSTSTPKWLLENIKSCLESELTKN